jgi:GNAT superfamily N-acetyltransferase
MALDVVIRQPQPHEYDSVRALIEEVVQETFCDLFAPNPVPLDFEGDDWSLTWVAVCEAKVVGVMLTHQEWVSDLWVVWESRRQGVGRKLLAKGESEIVARGHQTCRLRVVKSNTVPIAVRSAAATSPHPPQPPAPTFKRINRTRAEHRAEFQPVCENAHPVHH